MYSQRLGVTQRVLHSQRLGYLLKLCCHTGWIKTWVSCRIEVRDGVGIKDRDRVRDRIRVRIRVRVRVRVGVRVR